MMKISNLVLIISISLILIGCGKKKVSINDKWNAESYTTDLYLLEDDSTNKEVYGKLSAFNLTDMIDKEKSLLDTLKTLTYKDAIAFLIEYKKGEPERELKQLKEQLEREIASIKDGFDGSGYKESVQSIQLELVVFEAWSIIYRKAKKSKDKEIKQLAETLKKEASKVQAKEFPLLRKAYAEKAKDLLWENNIDVKVSNSKTYQKLTFIGAVFANNKNIKEMQTQVNDITDMLRFKEVHYKWYEGEDGNTYYDLKPKKDTEL